MIRLGRTLKSQHRNTSRSWYIASTSAIATTGVIGTIYFAQTSKDVATETERALTNLNLGNNKNNQGPNPC